METYQKIWTKAQQQIFTLLCINSGKNLNHRQIAKMLKLSPTTVSQAIDLLAKEALVIHNKGKDINLHAVSLNRDSPRAVFYKKLENLRMLYDSGLIETLFNTFTGATIILFGSYARGEDVISSDIDIAIIGRKEKPLNLSSDEKSLERSINLQFYESLGKVHKHLRNNLLNGVVLSGSIEL